MRKTALICIAVLAAAIGARAEEPAACKLPAGLEKAVAKAAEVVNVNLDENMIKFAGNFLNKEDTDQVQAQKMLSGIHGICVRSLKFDTGGQYTDDDVQVLRSQFRSPTWSNIVGVQSKRGAENVDVLLRMEKGAVTGLAVIAANPLELTFVHIDGAIDPAQFSKLGGRFGIPKIELPMKPKPAPKADSK
ncbi:MAG TPA: DUF4252 domain-containing protein [Acidobacteriota bacterium]|nr:DUF4252 domain-containing protein [Acidobacteriota bacterium]